jgi:PKD repeat protein
MYVKIQQQDLPYQAKDWAQHQRLLGRSGGGAISSQTNTVCNVVWGSSGTATLNFTIVTSTGVTIVKSLCVKKQTNPSAKFTMAPYNTISDPSILYACIGQTINLVNLSASNNEIVSYDSYWDLGNGTTSTVQNPTIQYNVPGIYLIKLSVTNSCGCTSTLLRTINVSNRGFDINTPSTVCQGQLETYSVDVPACNTMSSPWSVIGGTKISQTYNSVTVLWNNPNINVAQGLYPLNQGIGTVTYNPINCGLECTVPTSIQVPVVKLTEPIVGLTSLCTGQQASYKLPQWPTTDFRWKIIYNGQVNPTSIQLLTSVDRNEVFVRPIADSPGIVGFPGGPITLVCNYTNTLLHCGGTASLIINIGKKVAIQGSQNLCINTSATYTSANATPINWIIKNSANTTVASATAAISIVFSTATAGTYTLTTSGTNICSEILQITVKPPPVTVISTVVAPFTSVFTNVCPNTQYTYKVSNPVAGAQYTWSVANGVFVGSNVGPEVAVKFNPSTTNSITVVQQQTNALICSSLPATKPIQMRVINEANSAIISTLSTPSYTVCGSTSATYKTPYLGADSYVWSIEPASLGTITSGFGTNQVTINWNNAQNPAGNTANLKLSITKCSVFYVVNPKVITILGTPNISIVRTQTPLTVCSGSPLTISLAQPNPYLTPTTQVTWIISGQANITTPPGVFSYDATFFNQSNNITTQTVKASFTLAGNICLNSYITAPVNVEVTPGPGADLSSSGNILYCTTASPPIPLTAVLTATSPTSGVTYQWYKDGVLLTATTSGLTTAQIASFGNGNYSVRVLKNGCTTISNSINIAQSCNVTIPCSSNLVLTPSISYTYSCNTSSTNLNPTVTVTGIPSPLQTTTPVLQQIRVVGPGINGGSTTNPFSFTPQAAGIYNVSYITSYTDGAGVCTFFKTQDITVPYLPSFNFSVANCAVNNYTLNLSNTSGFISTVPEASRTFKFYYSTNNGATYTLLSSTQTASLVLTNNNYLFKLVIQGTLNGVLQPACEKVLTFGNPNPTQTIIATPINPTNANTSCYDTKVNFSVSNPVAGDTYLWNFADGVGGIGATNNNQITSRVFANIGVPHNVILTITSPYGCSRTLTKQVVVPNKCFNGNVISFTGNTNGTLSPQTCKGGTVDIRYMAGPSTDCATTGVTYTLMNEQTVVASNTTGNFNVTTQGFYWLKLSKAGQVAGSVCVYETPLRVIPSFLPLPTLTLSSPGSICVSEATVGITTNLSGSSPNTTLSYTLDGGASVPLFVATNTGISLTGLSEGNHSIVVTASQDGCTVSQTTTVTVVAPPAQVSIGAPVYTCAPSFYATLTASATGTGNYLWSNGSTGPTTSVTQGGPISVKFIGAGGCYTNAQTDVLSPPNEYLWMFPSGNYFVCKDAQQKIIGPNGSFGQWNWLKNGINSESGTNSYVAPYPSAQGASIGSGIYNLNLTNAQGGCTVTSLPMNLNVGSSPCFECLSVNTISPLPNYNPVATTPAAPFCAYQVIIPLTALPNLVAGSVVQATPQANLAVLGPVTTTATSISFRVFPLAPFPSTGGSMPIQFTGTLSNSAPGNNALGANARKCLTKVIINLNPCAAGVPVYRPQSTITKTELNDSYLVVAPNPAKNKVTISYDAVSKPTIAIYDLTGRLFANHHATDAKASWELSLDTVPAGIYLVVLQENGQFVMQKKLIVE